MNTHLSMIQTIGTMFTNGTFYIFSLFLVKRPTFFQSEVTGLHEHKEVRKTECYVPYIARIPFTSSLESSPVLCKLLVNGVMMEPGTSE